MRSSIVLTAAFAATAFSTPMKRDLIVETDTATDLTYVTDVVTVTAGSEAPAATSIATTTTVAAAGYGFHWGHHSWHHKSSSAVAASSEAPAAPSSSSEAAPAPSTSEAAPAPSSYEAPAPAPSSSSEAAPAPSSYEAPTSSSSSVAATTTQAAGAAVATNYQQAVVNHHNYHRANHSAPDITWDDNMASLAQEIANTCIYAHNMSLGSYGQNIAAGPGAEDVSNIVSDLFYNGEVNYFANLYGQQSPDMSNFEKWGHFSQIVWKGTTKVGCATVNCQGRTGGQYGGLQGVTKPGSNVAPIFTVCNYSPPGNYAGEYGTNIGDSLNEATVQGTENIKVGSNWGT